MLFKKHSQLEMPALSSAVNIPSQTEPSSGRKVVPLVQLSSFAQLLENMHHIEVNSHISEFYNCRTLGLPLLPQLPL